VAGGLAGLFLLAFLAERASAAAAYIGILACLLFTAWATLTLPDSRTWDFGRFNFPFHNYMIGVIGHVVLFLAGYTASYFFPNNNPETRALTLWGWLRIRKLSPPTVELHQFTQ
jgi:SSS family solute:Na+ symporter